VCHLASLQRDAGAGASPGLLTRISGVKTLGEALEMQHLGVCSMMWDRVR